MSNLISKDAVLLVLQASRKLVVKAQLLIPSGDPLMLLLLQTTRLALLTDSRTF